MVMFSPFDNAAQDGKELERGHAQPICPIIPDSLFIPESEPEIENYDTYG